MSVRMRHTRAHTANRRSHHALKAVNLATCSKCKSLRPGHTVCTTCGTYRGRTVIDVVAQAEKRAKRDKDRTAR